jgi:hypothetical protein
MSSSISSSDISRSDAAWGRCLAAFLGALGIGALLILVLMVLVDPYDSGQFGLLGIEGVVDQNATTADASRARDPRFDSAIFGNSTGQLLDPADLSPATGKHFVQLVAPGADPRGQLAILDFFIRHHPHIGALVVVTDELWCSHNPAPLTANLFPFWLYDGSKLDYARHLFSWRALDHAFQRITIGLGSRKRMAPDGFWSYEEVWPPGGKHPAVTTPPQQPPFAGQVSDVFPIETLLEGAIKKLPAEVAVVLLVPPTFFTIIPQPGSLAAAEHEACNKAFRSIVAGRPHSNFIDYRIDNALSRDPANFVDLIHYRAKIAQKIDQGVIASFAFGNAAKIDF